MNLNNESSSANMKTPEASQPELTLKKEIQMISDDVQSKGFTVIGNQEFVLSPSMQEDLSALQESFENLEQDPFMDTETVWRLRRFGRFGIFTGLESDEDPDAISIKPIEYAPYQSKYLEDGLSEFNVVPRAFPELEAATYENACVRALIKELFAAIPQEKKDGTPWEAKVHQVRVLSFADKIVKATPEGIHEDGHDFFAIVMMQRKNIEGAMSRIWSKDQQENPLFEQTLAEPLDTLLVHDRKVLHDATAMEPAENIGYRDVLIISMDKNPEISTDLIQK